MSFGCKVLFFLGGATFQSHLSHFSNPTYLHATTITTPLVILFFYIRFRVVGSGFLLTDPTIFTLPPDNKKLVHDNIIFQYNLILVLSHPSIHQSNLTSPPFLVINPCFFFFCIVTKLSITQYINSYHKQFLFLHYYLLCIHRIIICKFFRFSPTANFLVCVCGVGGVLDSFHLCKNIFKSW